MHCIRFNLSLLAMLIGSNIEPFKIVRFIQIRRRELRALRFRGLQKIHEQNSTESSTRGPTCQKPSLLGKLLSLLYRMVCVTPHYDAESTPIRMIVPSKKENSKGLGAHDLQHCTSPTKDAMYTDDEIDQLLSTTFVEFDCDTTFDIGQVSSAYDSLSDTSTNDVCIDGNFSSSLWMLDGK